MKHDLIVVGGGIAGCEAAYASARAGVRTLLVTTSLDTLYALAHDNYDLNAPSGSLMAACTTTLEATNVNAVALRREAKRLLEAETDLHLLQSTTSELLLAGDAVIGISTWEGVDRLSGRVALCVGSFLNARLRVGTSEEHAGRLSEMAYDDLYHDLVGHGFLFETAQLRVDGLSGGLPYTVDCAVLSQGEWTQRGSRLARFAGLYAAGACVGRFGYVSAAQDGMALAASVVEDLGTPPA
ncbi:MAG TPA: FAD-dependent oxidoreductase [Trueperaceae bacterium]|nr:FAD-dependent oxidoreductase [Trueperaceae bacterium]